MFPFIPEAFNLPTIYHIKEDNRIKCQFNFVSFAVDVFVIVVAFRGWLGIYPTY